MSKLQDLLLVFKAGNKIKKEINDLQVNLREKEEELKLLITSVGDHINMVDSGNHISPYEVNQGWELIEKTCKSLEENK